MKRQHPLAFITTTDDTGLSNRLTSSQKKFVAEVIGTFIVVILATGSVVIDAKTSGVLAFLLQFLALSYSNYSNFE
jgi:hypothetical protein